MRRYQVALLSCLAVVCVLIGLFIGLRIERAPSTAKQDPAACLALVRMLETDVDTAEAGRLSMGRRTVVIEESLTRCIKRDASLLLEEFRGADQERRKAIVLELANGAAP